MNVIPDLDAMDSLGELQLVTSTTIPLRCDELDNSVEHAFAKRDTLLFHLTGRCDLLSIGKYQLILATSKQASMSMLAIQ
jgi:hypothetical protein